MGFQIRKEKRQGFRERWLEKRKAKRSGNKADFQNPRPTDAQDKLQNKKKRTKNMFRKARKQKHAKKVYQRRTSIFDRAQAQ